MPYYSKRNLPFQSKVSDEFWEAFKAYVRELLESGYFPWGEYEWNGWRNIYVIKHREIKQKILQELGRPFYPLHLKPSDEEVFDIIEFFYKFVSKPGSEGPVSEENKRQGRYEYTKKINEMFDNFRIAYRLEKGRIRAKHSELLDEYLVEIDFEVPDEQIKEFIEMAIKSFYSRNFNEQKIGLEKLVDALQRITSWEDTDKKKSIERILAKLFPSEAEQKLREIFQKGLKVLWDKANEFMIRHTERDKKPVEDKDILEYLFYEYFNIIRFILKKYKPLQQDDTVIPSDDDIPF